MGKEQDMSGINKCEIMLIYVSYFGMVRAEEVSI